MYILHQIETSSVRLTAHLSHDMADKHRTDGGKLLSIHTHRCCTNVLRLERVPSHSRHRLKKRSPGRSEGAAQNLSGDRRRSFEAVDEAAAIQRPHALVLHHVAQALQVGHGPLTSIRRRRNYRGTSVAPLAAVESDVVGRWATSGAVLPGLSVHTNMARSAHGLHATQPGTTLQPLIKGPATETCLPEHTQACPGTQMRPKNSG
jgi:hypothetical protein